MLSLKDALTKTNQTRSLFSSISTLLFSSSSSSSSYSYYSLSPSFTQNVVADSFKTWFKSSTTRDPLLHRISNIISSTDEFSSALSSLPLPPLTEPFVLSVLRHLSSSATSHRHVLSSLKFFDWAGHQPGYHHSRATFTAIFRILSNANLMPLILDFLHTFRKRRYAHRVRFNDTLVIGYAIAGKPEIALHVFGKMRFQGLDLDTFGYHVLLNALVEQNYFNAFEVIAKQIRLRGYENHVTDAIVIKSLCKQGRLDDAEAYFNGLVSSEKELDGSEVSVLVSAFCQNNRFDKAIRFVREFGEMGLVPLDNAYGVWIRGLVCGGRLDEALQFFWQKKDEEGYVPGSVRYNILIWRLLRENRLRDVYDLLMDMNETSTPPDMVTMNAVMCFFCKAGMVDVALELYNSRSQFGLSPNHMAYKYLILTLCWDGCVKEAYSVLKSSVGQGYFPDKRTFSTLASALCRECKIDEMKELLHLALGRNIMPNSSTYDKFISALCRSGRVEDGYLMHGELNNESARMSYYTKMIMGFKKLKRGDIAARLLVEMKGKGYILTRPLFRAVLCCLLEMDNPNAKFFNLLEMLSRHGSHCQIYNCFIEGAGLSKKADMARQVFELMQRNGIEPDMSSQVLMLKSYLQSESISEALSFFHSLRCQGIVSRKLFNTLIVGLCKSNKVDIAREFLFEMIKAELNPSIECYEVLVQQLCSLQRYIDAINVVNLYEKMGRRLTSFIGNVLLYHSLISRELYDACAQLRGVGDGEFSGSSMLTLIIGAFSGQLRVNHFIEDLEELISKCFPLDIYTYNLLLRKASHGDMDQAFELFRRMCQRGYEPNWWTYDVMVHGFSKHGRQNEAKRWVEEMSQKGLYPKESTRRRRTFV
ncbi:putative pentatricopeptide [Lupinus albus]|uniref:Putative pentatricopeptide n=1 Tax=Lupinus albus TaxID=3870 RepID=A0A6A4QLS1_LUPAL|nr:putative pentatricopeptide [Lupinus albus]